MSTREAEPAYSIPEAAEIKHVSETFIRRAIRSTEANHLRAKRVGHGYRIKASDLDAWFDGLEDA